MWVVRVTASSGYTYTLCMCMLYMHTTVHAMHASHLVLTRATFVHCGCLRMCGAHMCVSVSFAAAEGHQLMAELLLDNKANIDAHAGEYGQRCEQGSRRQRVVVRR